MDEETPSDLTDCRYAAHKRPNRRRRPVRWRRPRTTHSSGGAAASFGLRPTRLLEPTFGGAKRGALSAVTGIAEEGTGLRPPALGGLAVADAHEVTVRSRRCLIDAADAGRQAAA